MDITGGSEKKTLREGCFEVSSKGWMGISHVLEESACRKPYCVPAAFTHWELLEDCVGILFISVSSVPGAVLCTQMASRQWLPN